VIVAYGDEVVMEENLESALQRIFGKGGPRVVKQSVTREPGDGDAGISRLAREAMAIYDKAVSSQRQGDWAAYGDELRKLREVLQRMAR